LAGKGIIGFSRIPNRGNAAIWCPFLLKKWLMFKKACSKISGTGQASPKRSAAKSAKYSEMGQV
jgi:hypothetical protein